jgi:glucose-6-phosphate 1-dehydrogenase
MIVIFGASGDLAHRELIPALFDLFCKKLLPAPFAIVGFARTRWSNEEFRQSMFRSFNQERNFNQTRWNDFSKHMYYTQGDFDSSPSQDYELLRKQINKIQKEFNLPDNILFHLAVPPGFHETIVQKMDAADLTRSDAGWRRVIIEKPFGLNEETARELDDQVRQIFDEEQIYRIDHFLGKETVQNMLVFRFANPSFEPIWNRHYIDHIQITAAEEIGIGKRGSFYDKTGIVRDMIQNHLLQLLCLTTMSTPIAYDAFSLRTETLKVLKTVIPVKLPQDCVLGQYGPGIAHGEEVRGYRNEENVPSDSTTATFAAVRLFLENSRWAGVPIYLRSGKRMKKKITEIVVSFKPMPYEMFPMNGKKQKLHNVLAFRLQPEEGIVHIFLAKKPGAEIRVRPVQMNFRYDIAFGVEEPPSAYEWLILDAIQGDQTLFPHSEWIYEAWSIVDPITQRWRTDPWSTFPNYEAGSWGPPESDELIRASRFEWLLV